MANPDGTPAELDAEELTDTPGDAARLRRARKLASLLDDAITVPVVRYSIGIDAIAGLVPVVGDALTTLLSLVLIWEGYRLGVDRGTLVGMLLVVALDFVAGSVPVVGDLIDAVLKANRRNVRAIERSLAART